MSEEKYRAIFKNSIDAVLFTSPDGTILEVNPTACKMFRMTEEEIIKAGRYGITDSSDPRLQPALEERAGTGKFRGELNYRRKGQFSPETISMWERLTDYLAVALAKTRAEEKLHVAYEDLQVQSEELQAQSEEIHEANKVLLESEAHFRTMANAIPQLAWIARPDGYIYWYNERWYTYTGTTPEQMEGWGWQSVHDPEVLPKVLEQWKASIATGQKFDMEFPLRGADGIFRQFLTRVLPFKDASGNILQWFGTNTDVTERKKTEEALKKAHDSLEVKVKERTAELEGAYKLSLENERRFNEAQKLAHIGSWDWDIATDELYWSDETYRIFGSNTHVWKRGGRVSMKAMSWN